MKRALLRGTVTNFPWNLISYKAKSLNCWGKSRKLFCPLPVPGLMQTSTALGGRVKAKSAPREGQGMTEIRTQHWHKTDLSPLGWGRRLSHSRHVLPHVRQSRAASCGARMPSKSSGSPGCTQHAGSISPQSEESEVCDAPKSPVAPAKSNPVQLLTRLAQHPC